MRIDFSAKTSITRRTGSSKQWIVHARIHENARRGKARSNRPKRNIPPHWSRIGSIAQGYHRPLPGIGLDGPCRARMPAVRRDSSAQPIPGERNRPPGSSSGPLEIDSHPYAGFCRPTLGIFSRSFCAICHSLIYHPLLFLRSCFHGRHSKSQLSASRSFRLSSGCLMQVHLIARYTLVISERLGPRLAMLLPRFKSTKNRVIP
ncbi:hypothetical protein K504DRAFT_2376 [Pleomassaria siparia CBS 279.74]|uniref:Uncharacterized protein n=1 Tax=Pleomassaria siparia CBS 279.74 TaxID=1314801 RepID=A0A6G1KPB4_9PLEO|nr:hypothetical protein K504DRAFT_2376 [Pleomassaria siparia CBS 279.74]